MRRKDEEENVSFQVLEGKVWKFGDNISTDDMMPGFAQGATQKEKAKFCMRANRPDFSGGVRQGDGIIGGKNFGCGSGRTAAANLIALGISCVIAESFGRIFFRNSINLGFPVLMCRGVCNVFEEGDLFRANIETGKVENLSAGKLLRAEPLPEVAVRILSAGGIIPLLKREYGKPSDQG